MSTSSATHAASRHPRVLACVLCQHRKIKCDRNTPCSNCLKANVTCTPSTPAPARKRRRPNQDLQERLARCEALLKQYAGASGAPPAQSYDMQQFPTPAASSSIKQEQLPLHQPQQYQQQQQEAAGPSPATSGTTDSFEKLPAGRMIEHEGGSRFIDNQLWTSFYEELQAMRQIVDTEEPEESSALGTEGLTPDNNADLLFPWDGSSNSTEDFHPDPVQAFRLWQIYLDRVNPLTKVIHVPTVQPFVIESTTNPSGVPSSYQALLYAVFLMATVALTESEAQQLLRTSRDQALRKFTSGTKQSLLRFDFIRNYDMPSLQALVLFLLSLRGRYDRHATWVLSGTIVRIATKMGYHRDGELLNLNPFETEMRRRIWWQILLQDTQSALVSGLNHSLAQSFFDTKPPQNLNDADLFPDSQEPVQSRDGPTEMGFILVACRLTQFMVSEETRAGFEQAVLSQGTGTQEEPCTNTALMEKHRAFARELDRDLREIERKYVDESAGDAHRAALSLRPMVTTKLQEMLVPMQEQPEWGTEIFGPKDNFFKMILINSERAADTFSALADLGYGWLVVQHFQLDLFAVLTGQLAQHPTGSLSDRGWTVVARTYKGQPALFDMSQRQYAAQAQFTMKAWKAREQAFVACGRHIETPAFIQTLRDSLPSHDSRSSTGVSPTPVSSTQPQQPTQAELDQLFGGYLDFSALNWDAWGDMMSNNMNPNNVGDSNQASQPLFGQFGIGNMGNTSGM